MTTTIAQTQTRECDNCSTRNASVKQYEVIDDEYERVTEKYYWCDQCKKDQGVFFCRSCKKFVFKNGSTKKQTKCEFCKGDISIIDAAEMFYDQPITFFTPKGAFKKDEAAIKDEVFFGVEFEVEIAPCGGRYDYRTGRYTTNKAKDFQLKDFHKAFKGRGDVTYDESLNCGVEIRSNPMTFDELYNSKVWDRFFSTAKKKNAFKQRASTAGMHVHVSENALSQADFTRIMDFFIKCNSFVAAIAERGGNEYVEYDKGFMNEHYGAINHARDTKTYEFRIFQTVVDKTHFYKNIEFVKALVDYCQTRKGEITVQKFFGFINQRYTKYPNLKKFMYGMGFRVNICRHSKAKKTAIGRYEKVRV